MFLYFFFRLTPTLDMFSSLPLAPSLLPCENIHVFLLYFPLYFFHISLLPYMRIFMYSYSIQILDDTLSCLNYTFVLFPLFISSVSTPFFLFKLYFFPVSTIISLGLSYYYSCFNFLLLPFHNYSVSTLYFPPFKLFLSFQLYISTVST